MLNSMDSREIIEWEIFNAKVEPVGNTRLDWLFAMLANILALVNGNKKSTLTDYLLFPLKPPELPTEAIKSVKPANPMRAKIMTFFKGYKANRRAQSRRPQRA